MTGRHLIQHSAPRPIYSFPHINSPSYSLIFGDITFSLLDIFYEIVS